MSSREDRKLYADQIGGLMQVIKGGTRFEVMESFLGETFRREIATMEYIPEGDGVIRLFLTDDMANAGKEED